MSLEYNLWFFMLKINRRIKREIMNLNITPKEIFNKNLDELVYMGIDIITAEYIVKNKDLKPVEEIIKQMNKKNFKFVFMTDEVYPYLLKSIEDAPIGLFYIGNIMLPKQLLAIVGSRRATNYGKTVAYKISLELSKYNIGIVSGMARGIDTEAHNGAIDSNGFTIAVLGSGFNNIYPKENIKLMNKIIDNGCVFTEYLPDVKPFSFNFPERNRIISGLSNAVLVVEAGISSGSMITVNYALEQGRDVFAVPGDIYKEQSKGCNKLIKEGAKLVDTTDDILEEFGIRNNPKKYNIELDEYEKNIINYINEGNLTFEQIKLKCKYETSFLLSKLTILECKGIIKRVYGGNYVIIKS